MDAGVWGAIAASGPAGVIVAIFFIYGVPAIKDMLGWQSAREKEIRETATALAKEGTTAFIANLSETVKKLEERCEKVEGKYDALLAQHHHCEMETARLNNAIDARDEEIIVLRARIVELEGKVIAAATKVNKIDDEVKRITG